MSKPGFYAYSSLLCDAGSVSTWNKIEEIIKIFARGDRPPPGKKRIYATGVKTCSTDGETIFSYDEPIAVKLHDSLNTVLVRDRWRTPRVSTTDRHICRCKQWLPGYGFRVEVVPDVRRAVEEHKSKHRYSAARPHGRCERAGYCVENEADPTVPSCEGAR